MATEQPTEVKSITNIYYDCLERIFEFLDLEDLLNVAGTCKRLQIAAAAKFGDDHGGDGIRLFQSDAVDVYGTKIGSYGNHIEVGRKLCLPFLRCFGSKIKKLFVDCGCDTNYPSMREQYINQYCADSLTYIHFDSGMTFPNENIQKPFKNITGVVIGHTIISKDQWANFSKWFPNVDRLYLRDVDIDESAIELYLPHLEHISIAMCQMTNKNVAKLLHANQQLQSLEVGHRNKIFFNELSNMISGNPSIIKLTLYYLGTALSVDTAELMKFASEHTSMIELNLGHFFLLVDDIIAFVSQMNSLKQLKCRLKNRAECDRLINQLDNGWQLEWNEPKDDFFGNLVEDISITLKR